MQHKKFAITDKAKNIILIALAILLVTALIFKAAASSADGEVEAEYISPGTIVTTLRGSGTVTSNASVDVMSEKPCLVYSIPVQEGDEIRAGDVLIECSDYAAADAEKLKTELDGLILAYQLAIVDKSNGAYPKEQLAVEKAQAELERAKTACANSLVTDAQLKAAKDKVTQCEKAVAAKEEIGRAHV